MGHREPFSQVRTLEHQTFLGVKVSVTRRGDGTVWLRVESSKGESACADLTADEAWEVARAMLAHDMEERND